MSTLVDDKPEKAKSNPAEWTVDEVIDWLRSKGFGDDVCEKFIGMYCRVCVQA